MKDQQIYRGYAALELSLEDKTELDRTVRYVVPSFLFYRSQKYDYINGNVAANAHLTIFYGFQPEVDLQMFSSQVSSIEPINSLTVEDVDYFNGYNDEYQIIYLAIAMNDSLRKLRQICEGLPNIPSHPLFRPHITLAYIKNTTVDRLESILNDLREKFIDTTYNISQLNFCRYGERLDRAVKSWQSDIE
ncbi:MAG: 2'-5' RNA ligase family protein [Microcoleus sp.]